MNPMLPYRLLAVGIILSTMTTAPAAESPRPAKPNIIIITIDDLGYADIGPFGSNKNRTPALDRMAKEGCKLTSFYAAPVCSPSRAMLLTGCYPKRALPIPHVLFPADNVGLSPNEVTIAEILKPLGYATGIIGKWHLGDQPEWLPTRQGFDEYYGLPYSNDMGPAEDGVKSDLGKPLPKTTAGRGQPPLPLLRGMQVLKRVLPDDQQALVERYTSEAIAFINRHKHQPFFLYLPHNAFHFPIYPGKAWAGKSPHGYYSDWVEEVDNSVGTILNALRTNGLSEKTLVIFSSDNGGTMRGSNAPLRGYKGSTLEGGIRVPTIAWWPGQIPAGSQTDAITGMFDLLPTVAALCSAKLPTDRKLDGVNIWPQLVGDSTAQPAHEHFYYFRGLQLEAVRQGDWKLQIVVGKETLKKPKLFNLKNDIGESMDVAGNYPEIVVKLQTLAETINADLGTTGIGPGCRALGRVAKARPILDFDGSVAPGFTHAQP